MRFHLSSIIETAIIKKEDIMNAHNQQVIDFRGKVLPLLFLKDIFEVPVNQEEDEFLSVVIVRKGDKLAGLVVDSFIGQLEIVLKSLGNYLTSCFCDIRGNNIRRWSSCINYRLQCIDQLIKGWRNG